MDEPAGLSDVATVGSADVDNEFILKSHELRMLDEDIVDAIRYRIRLAQEIGEARLRSGHPRVMQKEEIAVIRKYRELGADGVELATILLRLSRIPGVLPSVVAR
jgi:chorismate mutase